MIDSPKKWLFRYGVMKNRLVYISNLRNEKREIDGSNKLKYRKM